MRIQVSALPTSLPVVSARVLTDSEGGAPLRCCLRDSRAGEKIRLGSVVPPGPQGAYAEAGPVFLHADPCSGPASTDYPDAFRTRRQVFRSYDASGQILGGEIAEAGNS